ncbi:MAG TPA: hypothetical protein VGN64_06745, partial [Dyadobacter sp.]|nr:hypothetical protein [Dyadobacter sp.]
MIPESKSGLGKNVSEDLNKPTNVTGKFSEYGMLVVSGDNIQDLGSWLHNHAHVTLKDFYAGKAVEYYRQLHWTDMLALVELSKSKGINPYTKVVGFHAGQNNYVYMDELAVIMLIQEIANSNGSKDWNSMIAKNYPFPVDQKDTGDPYSPWNPKGIYFSKKPICAYDSKNGYIIFKDGEIIWTKTGGRYKDAVNGEAFSYDEAKQTVLFSNGTILNLVTLERVTVDK